MAISSLSTTIHNPLYECMERKELQALQLRRLKDAVARVFNHVPAYRSRCQDMGVTSLDLQTLDDLQHFPFTLKSDFRDNYPFGLFAVPMEEVVRIHSSSGTTGKPTVVGYTAMTSTLWAEVMARTMGCAGITRKDIMQVCYGYGLFTGGLGVHYGAERIGATVIPISGGNTKRQVMIMEDFGSTALACTPSYALYLAEVAEEMGMLRPHQAARGHLRRRALVGRHAPRPGAQPAREGHRYLRPVRVHRPGRGQRVRVPVRPAHLRRPLLSRDHRPGHRRSAAAGQPRRTGVDHADQRGVPVIRYRTRDITSLNYERCACGRTLVRMDRVTGRTDDMLIIRGVNVFPSQIEDVLINIEGTAPHYQFHVRREGSLDELEVWVEVTEAVLKDEIRSLEHLSRRISAEIDSVLNLSCRVKLVEPKTIERSEGKAKRVIDHRKM